MNTYKTLLLICILWSMNAAYADNNTHDFNDAKVAVLINIDKHFDAEGNIFTMFGNLYDSQGPDLEMSAFVEQQLVKIFGEMKMNYQLVERSVPSDEALNGLKKKQQKKLKEDHHKKYLTTLKSQQFTDLIQFKVFPQSISTGTWSTSKIIGYGVYRAPAADCIFHTVGYIHYDLQKRNKPQVHVIKRNIPEKNKIDRLCSHWVEGEALGISWNRKVSDYSKTEQQLIFQTIRDQLFTGMIDTFQRHGMIKSQLEANKITINLSLSNYVVIEKHAADHFSIGEQNFNSDELVSHLSKLVDDGVTKRILVGLKTRSNYTFGDLKKVFIPIFKDTPIQMFRLGPEYELIRI